MRARPLLNTAEIAEIDSLLRKALRTLRAVAESVAAMLTLLRDQGRPLLP